MINKAKAFIEMRKELHDAGVIGVSIYDNEIHVKLPVLLEMSNVQFEPFNNYDVDYPFKAVAKVDGITFFALVSKSQVSEIPQLEGYMIEDVNLSGEEHVS